MNENKFKFKIIKNYFHERLILKNYKKITNTSLIIIWKNKKTRKLKYLIQKRSKLMKNGKNKLAIGGGMIEKSDESLQFGAIREIIEESQVQFKNKNNLDIKTIRELEQFLFPLGKFQNNFTFYMIIESIFQPKILGPVTNNDVKPFLNSLREIDLENNNWNDNKIKKIKNGHAFLSKEDIERHYKTEPKIWRYSKFALEKLFQIFE
jgi:8-oxo-dGTP pyrophosphatase MutT (NUDIX family)